MKAAKVQRVRLEGEAFYESFVEGRMTIAQRDGFYQSAAEKWQRAGCVGSIERHFEAARAHLATAMVLRGELPAVRKHMVECN